MKSWNGAWAFSPVPSAQLRRHERRDLGIGARLKPGTVGTTPRAVIPAEAGTHDKHQLRSVRGWNEGVEPALFFRSHNTCSGLSIVPACAGMTAVGRLAAPILVGRGQLPFWRMAGNCNGIVEIGVPASTREAYWKFAKSGEFDL
ncbi:MAG: hypothetical protein ABL904_00250 [Hyphomicrobiaceae bacterium]